MNLFYHPAPTRDHILSHEEAHHCVKVLRMRKGDRIDIVDGLGGLYEAELTNDSVKNCEFEVISKRQVDANSSAQIHIAIAPTKSPDRIEWFVEKVCELGISKITFINTERTLRKHLKLDRLEKKTISALKQSKNLFKTELQELQPYQEFLNGQFADAQKFIAHIDEEISVRLSEEAEVNKNYIVLIGPEGDFSSQEVSMAEDKGFVPVALGNSVLRTETAGIIAAHTLKLINESSLFPNMK